MNHTLWYRRCLYFSTILGLIVIVVGAWVRLTDAGLGCPDWPGCYGRILVPLSEDALSDAAAGFEAPGEREFDFGAAWREMFHRYIASALGLGIIGVAVFAWLNRRRPGQPVALPVFLVGLVIFQGILGMWTVTLLLKPLIVMAHLLGGLATVGLLFWLILDERRPPPPRPPRRRASAPALAALVIVTVQIALGGWTSANYAALACPDLPTCMGQWWPRQMDFREAFIMWRGLGVDYEFGVLAGEARVAIHFTHRLGAIVTLFALIGIGIHYLRRERRPEVRRGVMLMKTAVTAQVLLGIAVVWFGLPLTLAAAHNAVAALLLATVINLNHAVAGPSAPQPG